MSIYQNGVLKPAYRLSNIISCEGFDENLESCYQIKVSYQNGKYIADEGKHRVCAMKRFGYTNMVPMQVTRISDSTDKKETDMQFLLS